MNIDTLKILYNVSGEVEYKNLRNYEPMIKSFGEILIDVHDNDYQGDSRYLLYKDGQYGFLVVGWGSCSGCDALQGCDSWEDVLNLYNGIESSIKWCNKKQMFNYLKNKDWTLTHLHGEKEENTDFIKKCLNLLEKKDSFTKFMKGSKTMLKVTNAIDNSLVIEDDQGNSVIVYITLENKEVEKGKRRKKVLGYNITNTHN